MRNPHGQRTGHNGKTLWSGSQLKQRLGCLVRWGHNRLLKLEEPEGKNAARGTLEHSEAEHWYLFGQLPTQPHACAALTTVRCQPRYKLEAFREPAGVNAKGKPLFRVVNRWIEKDHFVEVEVPVRFDHKGECFIGYIDMAYDWDHNAIPEADGAKPWSFECDGDIAPLGSTGVTVIHDWKFTSSTKYAMTPAELRDDAAANIYAWEAFLGGAKRVLCRWVYTAFDTQKPVEVWAEMDRYAVELKMDELAAIAAEGSRDKQMFKDGKLNVLVDLPKDFSYCHAYRQDCPFMGACNPHREVQKIKMRSATDMASFEDQVDNVTGAAPAKTLPPIPGAKKAPPPPPAKKAPPPPPAKASSPVDAAVAAAAKGPLTEHGTFNAPNPTEALKSPSPNPEAAAKAQGRDKLDISVTTDENLQPEDRFDEEAFAAHTDNSDLDGLDTAQLKLLATSMGLTFLPRAKTASMRKLIEDARAKGVPADRTEEDVAAELQEVEGGEPILGDGTKVVEAIASSFNEVFKEANEKRAAPPPPPAKKVAEEPTKRLGFVLYINCLPQGKPYTTLSQLIGALGANFLEATGKADYRQVDFGKGPGLMAESIADDLQSWTEGSLVIDTRTHEGQAFCAVAEQLAVEVVRGF